MSGLLDLAESFRPEDLNGWTISFPTRNAAAYLRDPAAVSRGVEYAHPDTFGHRQGLPHTGPDCRVCLALAVAFAFAVATDPDHVDDIACS